MKKLFTLMFCGVLFFCVAGCSNEANENVQTSNIPKETVVEDILSVKVDDVLDVVGNKERRFIRIKNESEQFLNGIVEVIIEGENGIDLYREAVFFQNKEPGGYESALSKTPIGEKIGKARLEVIRLDVAETPQTSPEITDENIYEYLYFQHEEMGNVEYGQAILEGRLINLTSQYFSGNVTYRVKDGDGTILMETIQEYKNLGPGKKKAMVDGAKPGTSYIVEYEITEYQFTDEPI